MYSSSASSSFQGVDVGALDADARTARLEHFLDSVLRKNLMDVMQQREEFYNVAASCSHLKQLLNSFRYTSLGGDSSNPAGVNGASEGSHRATTVQTQGATPAAAPARVMVDIGHHFYMQADILNTNVVHMNIGCGVVVPLTQSEAERFLTTKEKLCLHQAEGKTRESLRIKFRIRLVMEAISRLQVPGSS